MASTRLFSRSLHLGWMPPSPAPLRAVQHSPRPLSRRLISLHPNARIAPSTISISCWEWAGGEKGEVRWVRSSSILSNDPRPSCRATSLPSVRPRRSFSSAQARRDLKDSGTDAEGGRASTEVRVQAQRRGVAMREAASTLHTCPSFRTPPLHCFSSTCVTQFPPPPRLPLSHSRLHLSVNAFPDSIGLSVFGLAILCTSCHNPSRYQQCHDRGIAALFHQIYAFRPMNN